MHLLRFSDFIMQLCGVNRNGRAETTATPRLQSALVCPAGLARESIQGASGCVRLRSLRVQIIFD